MQSAKNHFSSLLALPLITSVFCHPVFGGENRDLEKFRLELASQATSALKIHNICNSAGDCSTKQVLFVSPASDGIAMNVYGVLNPEVATQIIAAAISIAKNMPNETHIIIDVYGSTRQKVGSDTFRWKSKRAIAVVIRGGSYAVN